MTLAPALIMQTDPAHKTPSSMDRAALIGIPLSTDLALHVTPAFALLVDFFAFEQSYSAKEAGWQAAGVAAIFCVWYSTWVEYCGRNNGTCE